MKKIGFATGAASGLAAVILGLAGPAQAVPADDAPPILSASTEISSGIDHHAWLDQIGPHVNVPKVDTSVRTRTVN